MEVADDSNLPFRKTQSMRATTNRRVQIVDSLKQRRLSNSSLDRELYKGGCGHVGVVMLVRGVVCSLQGHSSRMRMNLPGDTSWRRSTKYL